MGLVLGTIIGTVIPPSPSGAWYSLAFFSGNVEIWGQTAGDAPTVEGWRLAMFTLPREDVYNGYELILQNTITDYVAFLVRYDDGGATNIGSSVVLSPAPGGGDYWLIRTDGSLVQSWRSTDGGINWTKINEVTDTSYRGPFYPVAGATGSGNTGWTAIGGGIRNKPHFYRWVKSIQ